MTATRGFVAHGECRQSRSCYVMGCRNAPCTEKNRRATALGRSRRLESKRLNHGTNGAYADGCRCQDCQRAHKFAEVLYQQRKRETGRRTGVRQ